MQTVDTLEEGLSKIKDKMEVIDAQPMPEAGVYYARSRRAVEPPKRYVVEKISAVIKEVMCNDNLQNLETSEQTEVIEICGMMKTILFQHAVSEKPDEAMKALTKEVRMAVNDDIWDQVLLHDLTKKEK